MDASVNVITLEDLMSQYKTLLAEHLEFGGQARLDNLLAFQRVIRFYITEHEFDLFMARIHEE